MPTLLNLPRDFTLTFVGDHFTRDKIVNPDTGELIDNPMRAYNGQELKLSAGLNTVEDAVAMHPVARRFIVSPDDAAARPKAPAAPAVPTTQGPVQVAAGHANREPEARAALEKAAAERVAAEESATKAKTEDTGQQQNKK